MPPPVEPAQKPLSPRVLSAASRTLLVQCREIARVRLTKTLSEAFTNVEEDLVRLANASGNRVEQQVLLDAVVHVRQYRETIGAGFERHFVEGFDTRVTQATTGTVKPTEKSAELSLDEVGLMETHALDETIAVTELARETKNQIDMQELLGIRARISHLLGAELLDDALNPLAPEAVYDAMRLACAKVPGEFSVKRSLLTAFRPYFVRGISAAYNEVNRGLIAHDVLPKIKHTVQRAADVGVSGAAWANTSQAMQFTQPMGTTMAITQPVATWGAPAGYGGGNGGGYGGGNGGGGGGGYGGSGYGSGAPSLAVSQAMRAEGLVGGPGTNTTQQLAVHQLLSAGVPGFGGETGASPSLVERTDLATALANTLDAPPATRRLVARMLADPTRYAFDPVIAMPPTPALVSSLTQLQAAPAFAIPGTDYLAAIDAGVRSQAHPLDLLTVEFVNIVFDHILNDQSIPETVKAHIARLQIVAVKAAILDRSFFARREHPMRHLLDRIAVAGCDPEIDPAADGAFIQGLKGIVNHVVVNFKDDLDLFPQAEAQLETLIGRLSLSQTTEFRSTAEALEQKERAEVAHTSALAEIRRRVTGTTPVFLRTFLADWWSKVLVQAQLKDTHGDDSWTHRLSVVDALVWSVAPLAKSEITQLATMLPSLMRNLSRGMASVQMPEDARKGFFDELMKVHTTNISEAKGMGAKRDAATEAPVEEIVEIAAPAENLTDYHRHSVTALERGAVVEFLEGEDRVIRSKLSWISPGQSVYLFTSSMSNARSFSPAKLADALREGRARILDASEALMDRVVRSVVADSVPVPA